ncbi:sodium channel modifier 1-like isoform X2 [Neocloeon triangulifer]|uniref:sodium channel modifier 1-like isoform X2 n=1 Tax=Neocloeon triangulifer TaxID=2078957 RepID=UPI00286F56C7|nr:sodium channel modifier 1-like isoform X2 [Neocloeon triangulifer]
MFRREGADDLSLINHLQHRNVAELLSTHIPDHEALLLSDGKLTCVICSNRPVFDTIEVLAIHRSGKKHIQELAKHLHHKAELETKATQDSKESHVLAGLTTKDLATSELLRRTPSNSRRFNQSRRLSIETATPQTNVLTTPPDTTFNPNNLVRKYLRSIERSRSIAKTIEESRDSYGEIMSSANQSTAEEGPLVRPRGVKRKKSASEPTKEMQTDPEKSGWKVNKEGKWERDPEAEFESDEDEEDEEEI